MRRKTEQNVSGWTVDTLHSHVVSLIEANDCRYDERFEAQEQAVTAALAAAEKAVSKAEVASEKRFDAANEFRGQLSDQAQTFMPRRESEIKYDALADKIGVLENLVQHGAGRDEGITMSAKVIIAAVGGATAIVSAVTLLHH